MVWSLSILSHLCQLSSLLGHCPCLKEVVVKLWVLLLQDKLLETVVKGDWKGDLNITRKLYKSTKISVRYRVSELRSMNFEECNFRLQILCSPKTLEVQK